MRRTLALLVVLALGPTALAAQAPARLETVHVTVGSRVDSSTAAAARSVDVITHAELRARAGQSLQ
ncbi:MAG: hypothetical protein KGL93_01695, partial [Gemmatimonadota bacterium]|nr:hypothetical protein [Gemmatimonadota bacterium]